MVKRVDEAIRALITSEKPETLGVPKKLDEMILYTWEFGRSCRLLYKPDYDQRIVDFYRVCSHKEVYKL